MKFKFYLKISNDAHAQDSRLSEDPSQLPVVSATGAAVSPASRQLPGRKAQASRTSKHELTWVTEPPDTVHEARRHAPTRGKQQIATLYRIE